MAAEGRGAPKRRRLSRSGDFKRAYREGSSKASRLLVAYRFDGPVSKSKGSYTKAGARRDEVGGGDEREGASRLGVSVSRKIGDSVTRNRVKRVLKEAFWDHFAAETPGDVVLVARPGIEKVIEERGLDGAVGAMREVLGTGESPEPDSGQPEGGRST